MKNLYWKISILILIFFLCLFINSPFSDAFKINRPATIALPITNHQSPITLDPPFYAEDQNRWVDSIMKKLSPDERIGQLFMVAAYSNKDAKHIAEITNLIKQNKIGGLIFMQGGPVRQATLTNKYQKLSKVPLLIGMDAEWGLSMRLDSCVVFPRQMTMGAMQNDSLIYEMGNDMARQCKRLGVHISFSPDCDVNNNSKNPVIGSRSFGENKYKVAEKAIMYMKGLQDNGVLACGKHFPGHGDTESDSHKTLPVISKSKEAMDTLELYPFKQLINAGIGSIMVAHLFVPSYDSTTNQATTLSKPVVTGLLKEQLAFKGLVITDALNMKGVSDFYGPSEVDLKALLAGNDVLLFSGNVPKAIALIKVAISKGEISQNEIDLRCRKILMAKKWCGLNQRQLINTKGLYNDLNKFSSQFLCREMAEQAVTVLKNENSMLPLQRLDTLKIAALAIGGKKENVFQQRMNLYSPMTLFSIQRDAKNVELDTLLNRLKNFNLVILSLHNVSQKPTNNFSLGAIDFKILEAIQKMGKKVVIDLFGPAYALDVIPGIEKCNTVILSYEEQDYLEDLSAQLIFGGITAFGKLPVSTKNWKAGIGLSTSAPIRFKYTMPEEIGFSRKAIAKIDSIVSNAMLEKAFPGCQVFIALNGKVIYQQSYGFFTYENKRAVKNNDLYDIASVTKIMATVPAIMKMVDEKKINLEERLATYLPELTKTNKQDIVLREMLAHQAGLQAWIPFYLNTMKKDGSLNQLYYRKFYSDSFPTYVAPSIFLQKSYKDSIYKSIAESSIASEHKLLYSDLGYYYLKQIIEKDSRMTESDYVMKNFYMPLGLTSMGYQPRLRFPSSSCAPTENDTKFRKQQLQGDVHDQGTAMLGGVGGHAGIFSNANDVAVMMQLFLNAGVYGGKRYFQNATVTEFTRQQYPNNRRGIGFDKPEPDSTKVNPVCDGISLMSFGHQGFTGTQAWADPETGMVFVFLSNRVYPDVEPNKLAKMGVRGQLMKVIVEEAKIDSSR